MVPAATADRSGAPEPPADRGRPSAGFNADVPAAVAKNRVQPQKESSPSAWGQVNHTSFGNGTVLAVEGAGDKTVAKVKFDVGEKRLLLRYAPLTKLDA